jgi:large subunit ribosomal protein L10
MPTQAKVDEIVRLKTLFERSASLVLVDYRGITANEMVRLRQKFTRQGLEFRVVKNTLARIAAREAGLEGLAEIFAGPIGVAVGYDDPILAFKLSEECHKTYSPHYVLKGGVFEGKVIPPEEVKRYAALPSREELLTKLAVLLASPMRSLAVVLQAKIRELLGVLNAVRIQREQQNQSKEE